VTGGITDGWDRYPEPVEDIRITMAKMEDAPRLYFQPPESSVEGIDSGLPKQ
jgi:hypothetical protein